MFFHARNLTGRFNKVIREGRAGEGHHRRYKSASLSLLEHLLYLVQLLGHLTYPNTSRAVRRRAAQIEDQIQECRRNNLPPRNKPLLPRLLDVGNDSEDSFLAGSVALSEETSEEEVLDSPGGVWSSGRYRNVRVTEQSLGDRCQ